MTGRAELEIHDAFVRGDVEALRSALGRPADFPNTPPPPGFGDHLLEYAIYHSPISFVRALLELGADPRYRDTDGFPPLIAALDRVREDRLALVELLLDHGAELERRGVNDFTPLHFAAARDDAAAIELLLARGADPTARTRIDHHETPLEEAERMGSAAAARVLRQAPG